LSDEYGRVINFKDLIVVMRTNSGATAVMNRDAKSDAVKEFHLHHSSNNIVISEDGLNMYDDHEEFFNITIYETHLID